MNNSMSRLTFLSYKIFLFVFIIYSTLLYLNHIFQNLSIIYQVIIIVFRDYQIIVVGMLSDTDNECVHVERWAIRFNGNTKSECFIDFNGFTECANVNFSDQNIVNFAPTFPGSQQLQRFYMRNITRHMIK